MIAAVVKYPELEKLAELQNIKQLKPQPIKIIDSVYIDGIVIKGNKSFPRNYIRGKLRIEPRKNYSL